MENSSNYMRLCLVQAAMARPLCSPNPAVGAIIVGPDGETAGVGHTQHRGGPHAEIMALRDAETRGRSVKGATIYVSLEPCSHHGHTGPCAEALIRAGIAKVVASSLDPNPLVSGNGFAQLRDAGIEVVVGAGASETRELNIGFFSRMIRKRPWVRMKIAASTDGKTALENGTSQWITSEAARKDGHAWRARSTAILTGIGTILKDDPRLDVRLANPTLQPQLVVVDSHLSTPLNARIFHAQRKVLIYTAEGNDEKKMALEKNGAVVVRLPIHRDGLRTQVDLTAMLTDLARREINELHVESGPKLNGSLIQGNLVDEFLFYLAPKLLGSGLPMATMGPFNELSQAIEFEFLSSDLIGPDLRLLARIPGNDSFQPAH